MSLTKLAALLLDNSAIGAKHATKAQIQHILSRAYSPNSWRRLFCSEAQTGKVAARTPHTPARPLLEQVTEGATTTTTSTVTKEAAKSSYEKYMEKVRAIPTMPFILGFAGALPFVALSPPIMKQLKTFLPIPSEVIQHASVLQVGYGACIISFLGAVHWGAALSSKLAGPVAMKIANERYTWSVLPCLLAWPTTAMEPGPASLILGVLLPLVYVADTRFHRVGYLPQWYMTLRAPLTALASFGMLTSAIYFLEIENEKVRKRQQAAQQQAQ